MSCRSRYRGRNFQSTEKSHPQKKSQLPPLQKRCYCSADGPNPRKFIRKKTPTPKPGSVYIRAQKQEAGAPEISKNNKKREVEISFDITRFSPIAAAQVIVSSVECYTNDIYMNHYTIASEEDNLEFWMDCLEAMDWEHTCSHTSSGEECPLRRSREQTSFSCENLDSWGGDDWRMEWFPGPDMMDLSYESCRE